MTKKSLKTFLVLTLLSLKTFGQTTVNNFPLRLSEFAKGTTLPIQNEQKKTTLVMADEDKIHCYLLNDSLNVERNILIREDPRFLFKKTHIGNIAKGNLYSMFFYNKKEKNVIRFSLNYDSINVENRYNINLWEEPEFFVDATNLNKKVQVISVNPITATFYVNELDENGRVEKKEFKYLQLGATTVNLINSKIHKNRSDFSKISYEGNISLNTTQALEKLYAFDDQIVFTFDSNERNVTYLLTLNLKTNQINFRNIAFPGLIRDLYSKTNSFIYNRKLFQVISGNEELRIAIKELESGKTLKEFFVKNDREIEFKNGAIMQNGGSTIYAPESRELKTSNQLLRKIGNSKVAIAVNRYSDSSFVMTVGSYLEIKGGGGGMMMSGFGGIPLGSVGGLSFSPFAAPSLYNFGNNKMTKSAYFKSILKADDFSHINGEVGKNTYDVMNNYEENLPNKEAKTVFALKDKLIYGYYNSEYGKYYLVEF